MKHIFKKILKISAVGFFLFGINQSYATDVGGTIAANTTWTLANSPYVVTSNITLSSGYTLTIEPGVEVRFNNNFGLTANGKLLAQGNSGSHIIFTSNNASPSAGNWGGIIVSGAGSNNSLLDYVEVKYGGASASPGIFLSTTNSAISNSQVTNIGYLGVKLNGTSNNPIVTNNTIKNCTSYGLHVNSQATIINNNILDNGGYGLYLIGGNSIVKNNILKGNNQYGISNTGGGTPTIQYNLFYGNTTAPTYNYTLDGTNIVGLDPSFSTGTEYLTSGSPAINTGDPSFGNHPLSGNIYDIGRYEYTGYAPMVFTASVGSVSGRTLSYEWSFTQDPTNGTNPPVITNATGIISRDMNISCSFDVTKLGNYTLKIVIKDGGIIVGESTNSFTIVNQ